MSVYFDASVLVALFTDDPFTPRARNFVAKGDARPIVSDFAGAEFASAMARFVRMREVTHADAQNVFATFDAWLTQTAERVETTSVDIAATDGFLRRLDLTLRTPDALNIAIARRAGATLATFDDDMAKAARALGVAVAEI